MPHPSTGGLHKQPALESLVKDEVYTRQLHFVHELVMPARATCRALFAVQQPAILAIYMQETSRLVVQFAACNKPANASADTGTGLLCAAVAAMLDCLTSCQTSDSCRLSFAGRVENATS